MHAGDYQNSTYTPSMLASIHYLDILVEYEWSELFMQDNV